jgi:hypothetical protein
MGTRNYVGAWNGPGVRNWEGPISRSPMDAFDKLTTTPTGAIIEIGEKGLPRFITSSLWRGIAWLSVGF